MRRWLLAALVAATLLSGCEDVVPAPGKSKVDVDTPALRQLKAEVGMERCRPGRAEGGVDGGLPAVTLPCLGGGRSVDLATLRGPLVINTWASYCTPCIEEMPALQEFHERYGEKVAVLGIDFLDPMPGAALRLAEQTGATYPSLADPGGELLEQDELRVVNANPQFILVDAHGEVVHQEAGGVESVDEVVAMVEQHLGIRL